MEMSGRQCFKVLAYLLFSEVDFIDRPVVLHNEGLLADQETILTFYHGLNANFSRLF